MLLVGVTMLSCMLANTIVIVHEDIKKAAISQFDSYFQGNNLSTKFFKESKPKALIEGDTRSCDNLVILSQNIPYEEEQILEYIEKGGNFLWAIKPGAKLSNKTRSIAKSFAHLIEEDPKTVVDYFNNKDDSPSLIKSLVANKIILKNSKDAIYYEGISFKLNKANPLAFPVLTASASATESNGLYGKDNVLISALGARNGARIVVSGSTSFFLDSSFNREIVHQLVSWTFRKRKVQRIEQISPKILSPEVDYFRIKDKIEIEVCLSQFNGEKWEPFLPNDAQIELTMMTPWIRANLKPSQSDSDCLTTGPIQLPDRYGVYSLVFRYQRHGYTHLKSKEQLTVLPYRYDHSPRFVIALWPYYAAWLSQLASGLFIVLPLLITYCLKTKSKPKSE